MTNRKREKIFSQTKMENFCLKKPVPEDIPLSAKRKLVKIARSDGETTGFYPPNSSLSIDNILKSSKMKSFFSTSLTALCCVGDGQVLPSKEGSLSEKLDRLASQDDLWKSIKSNYLFLMNNNLISECYDMDKEMELNSFTTDSQSTSRLTWDEFTDAFNLLHDKMHSLLISIENQGKDMNLRGIQKEMWQFCGEYEELKDQAKYLEIMHPDLRDDISRRCTILSNKWELLEDTLWPNKKKQRDGFLKTITTQMKNIRKWLREVEENLNDMKICDHFSTDEIQEIYKKEKMLQQEIEHRGKDLTAVVRRCEESMADGATIAARLRRSARRLEKSWHNIWIRSLEQQCLTEQCLRNRRHSAQKAKEVSDIETDEGPVKKHRRLTADHWKGSPSRMDTYRRDRGSQKAGDVIKRSLTTRDVGILCSDLVPMNDKCIMVGTTGIAALKAEYGDDFTNFEIIQDVGYSSESSTHLSGDDIGTVGGDHYYNIRVYNYNNSTQGISLREELENAKKFHDRPLASSLESSSLDDSGLGVSEAVKNWSNPEDHGKTALGKDAGSCPEVSSSPEDESDFLETVFGSAMNFGSGEKGADNIDGAGIFQFELSSVESDDPSTTFQNRSSFASSAQVFYKMISVDSDNGEPDARIPEIDENHNDTSEGKTAASEATSIIPSLSKSSVFSPDKNNTCSDSDLETFKTVPDLKSSNDREKSNSTHCKKAWTSTPVNNTCQDDRFSNRNINLKRKRDSESSDCWQTPNRNSIRVRSWLKRCSDTSVRRSLFGRRTPDDVTCRQRTSAFRQCLNTSSCDASAECTSSSADEGNAFSSSSSYIDDDFFQQKSQLDSTCGSIETVLEYRRRADTGRSTTSRDRGDTECTLLPSPPFETPPRRLRYRNSKLKALSDGEVRKCHTFCDQEKTEPGINSPQSKSKEHSTISSSNLKPRHCSSLPCILRTHHSESSADDCVRTSALFLTSHSDVKTSDDIFEDDILNTSGVASNVSIRNHSGSSDVGRRRRRRSRKKSSSSNRSSLSVLHNGDSGRQRYNKTDPISHCGSRRRHFSQRSDFFGDEKTHLEVEIPPLEDNLLSKKDLESDSFHSDLELSFEKKFVCRDSSALPSPVESDVILTQLEEQSTVSDQVWDGYQDMPYLSEAYSESTIDEDAVRKLIEFGDDYTFAIGNPARHLEVADGNNNRPEVSRSPAKKSSKVLSFPKTHRLPSLTQDSDSDSEELHYLLKDTSETLEIVRSTLTSGSYLTPAECAHLLATCRTHLDCLRDICDQIETDGKESNFSGDDLKQLHYLIKEWMVLQKDAEMYEEHAHQKYIKAKENIEDLFSKMSEISSCTKVDTRNLTSWQEIKENVTKLQDVLSTLHETRERLVEVNLQVHHFTTDYGSYKDNTLKDDIVELYRQWDDVYEQNNEKLTHLQTLCNRWDAYDGKFRSLHSKIKEAEIASGSGSCDTGHPMTTSQEKAGLCRDLKELRDEVVFFESCLSGGMVWKTADKDLKELEKRVERCTNSMKASRSVKHPLSSIAIEDDPDDRFEDAIQHQVEDESDDTDYVTPATTEKKAGDKFGAKNRGSSRFWRVFRVAVPVQLALVLLYCLACYLEPNCCDMVNNFNFSFTPQLRYFKGPPPV